MHIYCTMSWVMSKIKKMKTGRDSAVNFFKSVFILCLKLVNDIHDNKRSKSYVPCLHIRIKYKSITIQISNKIV